MVAHLPQFNWRFWRIEILVALGLCLSFLIFFYWQHPPASLLLLVVAAVLAWMRLEIAIALLPLTFPYYSYLQPLRSSGSPAFYIAELGLFICLGVALLRTALIAKDRNATKIWLLGLWQQARFFLLPGLLLLAGASLALLASPDKHNSLRAYREEIIEPLLYFLLILRYLRTPTDLVRTMVALVLSVLIVSFTAIIQGVFHLTQFLALLDTSGAGFRTVGPYGSPNNLGMALDRAMPLLLALALTHILPRTTAASGLQRAPWRDPLRWACLLALIPMAWALYWSHSRGAEVAILAVVAVYFVIELRRWLAVIVVLVAGALATGLFWSRIYNFLNAGTSGHAGSVSERFTYWKAALLIIRDHFFLGTGPDSFGIQYNPQSPLPPTSPDSYALKALNGQPFPSTYFPAISHPHNFFLDFWISTGLLGLAALFWLLGIFAIMLVRLYRFCARLGRGTLYQRFLLGIAGCMIASFVQGSVDNSYFLPDLAMYFWLFMGSLLIVNGIARRELPKPGQVETPQTIDASLDASV